MIPFVLLITELICLYILSRALLRLLSFVLCRTFRSQDVALTVVTLLLFPGTAVHELSHLFMAEILGVPTGKLVLVPEVIRAAEVQTGSVAIAKTDPLRRSLIGIAPLLAAFVLISALSFFLMGAEASETSWFLSLRANPLRTALIVYLLFAISNTMFSSPQDLKGVLPFTLLVVLLVSGAFFAGIRLTLTGQALSLTQTFLLILVRSLGIVLGVNLILFLVFSLVRVIVDRPHF